MTAETLAARAKAGVKESGAQLLDLELLQPRHYALVAKLQVDNPADYLSHHARMFLSAIQDPRSARYDGRFIEVVDSKGELAWSDWLAVSEHGRGTSSSYLRPDLSGCDPIPGFGEPAARPPPAPCPADKDQSPSKQ